MSTPPIHPAAFTAIAEGGTPRFEPPSPSAIPTVTATASGAAAGERSNSAKQGQLPQRHPLTNNGEPSSKAALAPADKSSSSAIGANEVKALKEQLNEAMQQINTAIQFRLHEDFPEELVLRITDRKSGEVLRQIPPDDALALADALAEMNSTRHGVNNGEESARGAAKRSQQTIEGLLFNARI